MAVTASLAVLGFLVAELSAVPPPAPPTTVKPRAPATYRPKSERPRPPVTMRPGGTRPSTTIGTYKPAMTKPGQAPSDPPLYKPGGATYPIPDR
jgi:hypothetical protein